MVRSVSVPFSRTGETKEEHAGAGEQSRSMKVFLRNTQTGWYYQGPAKWTPEQEAAEDLAQVAHAVERIFKAHLENVEILLSYDDPRYDLVLPVPPSPSRPDPLSRPQPGAESRPGERGRSASPGKKGPLL